jgi:hypothetical protein
MLAVCGLATFNITSASAQEQDYETPNAVNAAKVLPQGMLAGADFRVMENVAADGMLYGFSMWTPFGWYRPGSIAMLKIRIAESRAITALDSMRNDPLLLEGLVDQTAGTIAATGNAIRRPLKTIKGIPLGLEKVGSNIQSRVNEGPVPGESGGVLSQSAKRKLAASLGVDPYSTNEQLQSRLNTIAAHKNVGALTAKVGAGFVGGGLQLASTNTSLQAKLKDQTAAELQAWCRAELHRIGVSPQAVSNFLKAKGYTATNSALITDALTSLNGTSGRERYITFVRPAQAPEVAVYYQQQIQMAAAYNLRQRKLVRLDISGDTPVFTDSSGERIVFAPIDQLFWSPTVEDKVRFLTKDGGKTTIYITGSASEKVKERLGKKGIEVKENTD